MGGDPIPGPLDILREWFYRSDTLAWNIERIEAWELHRTLRDIVVPFAQRCLNCSGPLQKRKFTDVWDENGIPVEVYEDLYCPTCKLRWLPMEQEPDEEGV